MLSLVNLMVPDDVKERFESLARVTNKSPQWLMIDALKAYLTTKEKRSHLIQEAIESSDHYDQTGLHITAEECLAWIDTWGTEQEKEPPKCHEC